MFEMKIHKLPDREWKDDGRAERKEKQFSHLRHRMMKFLLILLALFLP